MELSPFSNLSSPHSQPPDLDERIRRRAEEIYFRNGQIQGRDAENWRQAEEEVRREIPNSRLRTAIVVNVDGVQYVGEYRREASEGYNPGEFDPGASIAILIDGDRMLVKRPNGKVLETTIVQKVD